MVYNTITLTKKEGIRVEKDIRDILGIIKLTGYSQIDGVYTTLTNKECRKLYEYIREMEDKAAMYDGLCD